MKLAIISPFPPIRGGISQETEILYNALIKQNHHIKIFNFKKLYPTLFFPGKSQYIDNYLENPKDNVLNIISSINPISWNKVVKIIINENFDNIVFRYWHPFVIPAYNFIKNNLKKNNSNTKIFCICDNVFPHERFMFDRFLLKSFFKNIDGFFSMSSLINSQIKQINKNANIKNIFLPIKYNLGEKISKKSALKKLNIKKTFVILFFGFIRSYKGLDILLKALKYFSKINNDFKLLIVGECYEKENKYLKLIKQLNISNNIIWINRFVNDNEIKIFFSATDVVVLPYRVTSQSGIIPIAYNFNKLILVSDLEGLNNYVVKNKTGYLFRPNDHKDLANKLIDIYLKHDFDKSEKEIMHFKQNFSPKKLIKEMIAFIKNV